MKLINVFAFLGMLQFLRCEALYGQSVKPPETQVWFRGGYDSPSGFNIELAAQHSLFIVEGRLAGKEVIPDDVAGMDAGLLVGLATPAWKPAHLSITTGIARTWFSGDCEYEVALMTRALDWHCRFILPSGLYDSSALVSSYIQTSIAKSRLGEAV